MPGRFLDVPASALRDGSWHKSISGASVHNVSFGDLSFGGCHESCSLVCMAALSAHACQTACSSICSVGHLSMLEAHKPLLLAHESPSLPSPVTHDAVQRYVSACALCPSGKYTSASSRTKCYDCKPAFGIATWTQGKDGASGCVAVLAVECCGGQPADLCEFRSFWLAVLFDRVR